MRTFIFDVYKRGHYEHGIPVVATITVEAATRKSAFAVANGFFNDEYYTMFYVGEKVEA